MAQKKASARLEWWRLWGPVLVICAGSMAATYYFFVEPPPPRKIRLATGGKTGAYHAFGEHYREILARDGIDVELVTTAGSLENIVRLLADDPAQAVDVAFVQSGLVDGKSAEQKAAMQGLASVYREPLWIFYRSEKPLTRLADLTGKTLAVGPPTSGTYPVARTLLGAEGVTANLSEKSGKDAAEALVHGDVDAAFFVLSPSAPLFTDTLIAAARNPANHIRLLNISLAEAYSRRYAWLSDVKVSQGLLDLRVPLPEQSVQLVAPTATLVARRTFHPALIPLVLEAAQEIHSKAGLLDNKDEFPSDRYVDLPPGEVARTFLKNGPNFLHRALPFWAASWVDRLKVMLLPLLTLVLPLFKLAPPIYVWRVRSRILRWYNHLREADQAIQDHASLPELLRQRTELERIQRELPSLNLPQGYMGEYYNLRLHIEHVYGLLTRAIRHHPETAGAAPAEGEPTRQAAVDPVAMHP